MVYPQTALPVFVEIAPGAPPGDPSAGPWSDVTTSAFQVTDQITIEQGRGDWGEQVDAGTCSLTFYNPSGDFSEHNPLGQWYGLLSKDTPLRVGLRRAEDAFGRTLSAGWGTSDSGQVWSGFGAGGTVLATDQTMSGGKAYQSVPTTAAYRASWLPGLSLLDCRVRLSGVSLPFTDVTGASVEPGNIGLRAQDINTYYLCRVEITTAEAVLCKLYNPAGGLLASATVSGLTHSSAQTLEVIAEITGDVLRMKVWPTSGTEPSTWAVTATDATLAEPGGIVVRTGVASGNTNTLPVVASYDSVTVYADLFGGYVPAWVPRHDLSGKIRTVPVTAKGVLYQHQPAGGSRPSVSPFRRLISSTPGLLAYCPCEDLLKSTQAASALPGGAPMALTGTVTFADDTAGFERNFIQAGFNNLIEPGTADLPSFAAGGRLVGAVPAGVSSPVEWAVSFLARSNALQAGKDIVIAEWDTPGGTYVKWRLQHQSSGLGLTLYGMGANGVGTVVAQTVNEQVTLTEYRIECVQVGAAATVRLWVAGILEDDNTWTPVTLTRVTAVRANPDATSVTGTTGFYVGHIQVWDTATPPGLGYSQHTTGPQTTDGYGVTVYPFYRWLNETAHDRLERLCAQDGMAIYIPPVDADKVTRLGPQPDGIPLDLYRQAELADGGVLYERPFALGYVPRAALYTQTPALTLDASAGELAAAPAPDGSGQRYRNRWEVKRTDGSSAVAQLPDVAAGAITYGESEELLVAVDRVLPDQATWRLHLASGKDLRWPRLDLNMRNTPGLLDAWLNCRPGSRIVVNDPPADVADADIDVLLEGWTVTLGYKDMRIAATCSPAGPWRVATVGAGARVGSATAALNTAATTTAADLIVADPDGLWTTTAQFPADFPFDADVAGEQVTVNAITPALSDGFNRTVSNGWGSAETGQAYTTTNGAASDYSVSASPFRGKISNGSVNVLRTVTVDLDSTDFEYTVDMLFPIGAATGAAYTRWALGRSADLSNYYYAQAILDTAGNVSLYIAKRIGGLAQGLTSGGSPINAGANAAGHIWQLTFRGFGSSLRATIRNLNTSGPTTKFVGTDATITAGTKIGIIDRLETGNTDTLPVLGAWDNLTVLNPQKFTVIRSVNGIVKAHSPGAPVRLRKPYVVGL